MIFIRYRFTDDYLAKLRKEEPEIHRTLPYGSAGVRVLDASDPEKLKIKVHGGPLHGRDIQARDLFGLVCVMQKESRIPYSSKPIEKWEIVTVRDGPNLADDDDKYLINAHVLLDKDESFRVSALELWPVRPNVTRSQMYDKERKILDKIILGLGA